jgi:MoxR-like ATPase
MLPPTDEVASSPPSDEERVIALKATRARLVEQVRLRIVGQDEVIELMLIALFARGHGLFVGVPGLAKTLLITTVAEVLSLRSNRIQFTPDLMPTDITGTEILEEDPVSGQRRFRFVRGPIFTNILLADEINRTPPKTQAALLQSMAEGVVTAGGTTHALEKPYVVFATQNPIEQEGTYPLPEAQLDRFLFQIDVG